MIVRALVEGQGASFIHYSSGNLWYVTDDGFEFPVPITDTGSTSFFDRYDKAITLMRWIRKHVELIDEAKQNQG